MKLFLYLITSLIIASRSQAQSISKCPDDSSIEFNGRCFSFLPKSSTGLNFTTVQMQCDPGRIPVAIHSQEENDFIVKEAKKRYGNHVTFWIGISCDNGDLNWLDEYPFDYNNFHNPSDYEFCTANEQFIMSIAAETYWEDAPLGFETNYVVCSFMSEKGENFPSSTNGKGDEGITALTRQHIIELIILLTAMSVIMVLTLATCGCMLVITKTKRVKAKKKEEERLQKECADYLRNNNVDFNIEAGKFKAGSSAAASAAAGAATAAKTMERVPSMRYTAFPGAANTAEKTFDEWEIDRRFVSIDYSHKLGQGAFGSVYLGIVDSVNIPNGAGKSIIEQSALRKGNDAVAIKMLHESADKGQQMQFLEEIDLMKRLGYHERLVNMLACVTRSEPPMLVVEYCAHGDLLNYMRERRAFMLNAPEAISSIDRSKIITQKQQLMFCVQIAYGMEYLSQRGFVHRDIAARNILVDQNESCKIGDFGLCREVEKEDEHYLSRGGRLPLKWMSPEAIERYDFSIPSDVWAFGVLLFEIITLGGHPYPDWPAAEILNRLKRGRRMDRPDNCTDHMFAVMNSCWALNPADRPMFAELRMKIGIALEEVSEDDYYLKLNARAMYYCTPIELDHIEVENEEQDENIRL